VVKQVNASGRGGAFTPETATVKAGDRVRWVNDSGNIHNVTFEDASIKASTVMYQSNMFEVTFPKPGTYRYRCTFHPGMDGVVIVQ
jgi:plastocyanin